MKTIFVNEPVIFGIDLLF